MNPQHPPRADKRHAVTLLLQDEEWAQCSDREIARRCAVDHVMVGKLRRALSGDEHQIDRKVERNGTVYTQRTENIGREYNGAKADKTEAHPDRADSGRVSRARE